MNTIVTHEQFICSRADRSLVWALQMRQTILIQMTQTAHIVDEVEGTTSEPTVQTFLFAFLYWIDTIEDRVHSPEHFVRMRKEFTELFGLWVHR